VDLPNIHEAIVKQGVDGALRRMYDYLQELDKRVKELEGRDPYKKEAEEKARPDVPPPFAGSDPYAREAPGKIPPETAAPFGAPAPTPIPGAPEERKDNG
jgi:hypothetical protein